MTLRELPRLILIGSILGAVGCSVRYTVLPNHPNGFDYRLEVTGRTHSRDSILKVTCGRRPLLSVDSLVHYERRLSTTGWITSIGGALALGGVGAFGWSHGWAALGQYSIGLGVLLPAAAVILAPKHGEEKTPKSLLMFRPAVSEEITVQNLTRSASRSYTTAADGVAIVPLGGIKNWFSGREEIGIWIAPVAAKEQRIAAKVSSTGSVSQVSVEDLSLEMAEVENTVEAYRDFVSENPTSRYVVQARESTEALSWRSTCLTNTKEAYQEFVREFPQSESASAVPGHIEMLDWRNACQTNTRASYQEFKELHPQGESVAAIPVHIERADWDSASSANTVEAFTAFLQVHPSGAYTDSAQRGIEKIDWKSASEANTVQACDDYLRKYPDGFFKTDALELREGLLAEQQKGLLIGQWPRIGDLPFGYAMAKLVDPDSNDLLAVLSGDVFAAFPDLIQQYQTDLERTVFLKSAEADSLRSILAGRRAELPSQAFAFRVSSWFPEYNVRHGDFEVPLESGVFRKYAEHVIGDFWFEALPLSDNDGNQVLSLSVPQYAALSLERRRDSLEVWVCFRPTGDERRLLGTICCVEARQPAVILVDQESGELVWSKAY
jgi:outer membrane protein assembly factor BamD (BamD/ComL family)